MQASKAARVGKGVENIDRSSDLYGGERRHVNLSCMFPTKCLELPLLLIPHSIRDILPFLQFHLTLTFLADLFHLRKPCNAPSGCPLTYYNPEMSPLAELTTEGHVPERHRINFAASLTLS